MDYSEECTEFVKGITHPNEKTLAEEILAGKELGSEDNGFSLDFDQVQVDAMTDRLKGGGCFPVAEEAPVVEEAPAEEEKPAEDAPATDAPATDAPDAPADAPATAEAPATDAPAEGGDAPAVEEAPKADETPA